MKHIYPAVITHKKQQLKLKFSNFPEVNIKAFNEEALIEKAMMALGDHLISYVDHHNAFPEQVDYEDIVLSNDYAALFFVEETPYGYSVVSANTFKNNEAFSLIKDY